jgi:transcriptional pleiotropic regulator of transition state genes
MARKVDDLGRIVLPIELRRAHGIKTGDALDISVEGDAIILRKTTVGCVFCGRVDDLRSHLGREVCGTCVREMVAGSARSDTPPAATT